jgi:hypothetical protein
MNKPRRETGGVFLQPGFHFMLELIEQLWFICYALLTNSGARIPITGWHRWLTT